MTMHSNRIRQGLNATTNANAIPIQQHEVAVATHQLDTTITIANEHKQHILDTGKFL